MSLYWLVVSSACQPNDLHRDVPAEMTNKFSTRERIARRDGGQG